MPSKADKLLKRLRQTQKGWTAKELLILYQHFGFDIKSGSKHDIITHPDFSELRDTLTRSSGEISPDYARDALKSIEKVLEKDKQEEITEEDDENVE